MQQNVKIIIILFLAILLTGCEATYNLTIDSKEVNEELNVNNSELTDEQIEIYTTNPIPVDLNDASFLDYDSNVKPNSIKEFEEITYYDVTAKNKKINAFSNYPINLYNDSRIANLLFNNLHVNNYNNLISIYGYNGLVAFKSYPTLTNVTINIKTDMKVVKTDADKVQNNTYTWCFNQDSSDTKTLYIEMNPTKIVKEKTTLSKTTIAIICCGFLFIIILSVAYLKTQKKKYR